MYTYQMLAISVTPAYTRCCVNTEQSPKGFCAMYILCLSSYEASSLTHLLHAKSSQLKEILSIFFRLMHQYWNELDFFIF
jgi:hypothetical protein